MHLKDNAIEFEIREGHAGQLHTDGTYPDFAKAGICAWMYGRLAVGTQFRYPDPTTSGVVIKIIRTVLPE